jgi:glucose-6-phosphate 1-epimerase
MQDSHAGWLIADHLRLENGSGGLPRLHLQSGRAIAQVYLHGAHVTGFSLPVADCAGAPDDLLFLSASSHFTTGKAIRGGVPVIFPWFGPREGKPGGPMHGFARTQTWELESSRFHPPECVEVVLRLESSEATLAIWPHRFVLRHIIRLNSTLTMSLRVENSGDDRFTFEEALHTYLAVGDVEDVTLEGLEGCAFLDKTDGGVRKRGATAALRFAGETDRVYLDTIGRCVVNDPRGRRRLIVDKSSSATTVIWNPWSAKAAALADLGNEEWRRFVCVETANASENRLTLAPGEIHAMTATISNVRTDPN